MTLAEAMEDAVKYIPNAYKECGQWWFTRTPGSTQTFCRQKEYAKREVSALRIQHTMLVLGKMPHSIETCRSFLDHNPNWRQVMKQIWRDIK